MTKLRHIVDSIAHRVVSLEGDLSVNVAGLTQSSRDVRPGYIFVARAGERVDGRRFAAEAIEAGAAAIVSDGPAVDAAHAVPWIHVNDVRLVAALMAAEIYDHPARDMAVDFITGTNGKTSVSYLCEGIIVAAGRAAGVIGTIERRFAGHSEGASMTTPDAPELQALLARMRDEQVERVVMELSSHAIEQRRWLPIDFRVGVFTNATRDHIDYHRTVGAYHGVKKRAFTSVLSKSSMAVGAAVNVDDALGREIVRDYIGRSISYGIEQDANLRGVDIRCDLAGTRMVCRHKGGDFEVASPLIGRHNAYNVLAAVAYGLLFGASRAQIAAGLSRVARIPGRLDALVIDGESRVLIDYAHTPDALENVLSSLRQITRDRVVTVFGAGGDRDRGKRPLMGRVAQRLSDVAIVTSDNPRGEQPEAIVDDILEGMTRGDDVIVEVDREAAIARALAELDGDTLVLVAGKGHEDYQIIGDSVIRFDDRQVARRLLAAQGVSA